jgi:MinD-like ATPase involved in chromosome partitioning or flagellar assembly/predicted transcriptional regulator
MTKIVALHSFQHGTGKSSLTANLAVTFAQQGYRVGLIDTNIHTPPDIQPPGLHAFFGIDIEQNTHTLTDYICHRVSLQDIVIDISPCMMTNIHSRLLPQNQFYFIPFKIETELKESLFYQPHDLSVLSDAIMDLNTGLNLDYIFIDIQPGLSEATLLPIAVADIFLLVLRPEQADFQGTAVILDIAQQLELPIISLVVNQAAISLDFEFLRQQVEEAYQVPVAGILPFSEEVRRLDSQELFCLKYPDHSFSQTIRLMTASLQDATHKTSDKAQKGQRSTEPLSERSSGGITMLDVLTLPDQQRQLMNWMLRQGSVKLEEVIDRTGQDEIGVLSTLDDLIAQGFIQKFKVGDEFQYQPLLTSATAKKQKKSSKDLWKSLED